MRKRVLFTGAILALILILGSSSAAFASSGSPAGHGWESVAEQLNLSSADIQSIKDEIKAGKSVKDVLAEHNITMNQIRAAIQSAHPHSKHLSNTQIAGIAAKLGLNPADIQNDIAAGKSLQQILADHNITNDQLHAVFGASHPMHGKRSKKTS